MRYFCLLVAVFLALPVQAQDAGFVCTSWVAPDAGVVDAGSGSAGCGQSAAVGTTDRTIVVNGVTRQYRQSIPLVAYDPTHAHRLFIGYHGCGWQGPSLQNAFIPESLGGDSIWIYPTGLQDNTCGPPPYSFGWDPTPGSADAQFFDAVLASALARLCIDPNRVHVWGRSRGGYMAHTIAATRTNQLASAAVLSSALTVTPTVALPFMIYHAQNDLAVPYAAGVSAVGTWAGLDGCVAPGSPTTPTACSLLACTLADIEWCNPTTGGHWPASWAGTEALEFMLAHPRVQQ